MRFFLTKRFVVERTSRPVSRHSNKLRGIDWRESISSVFSFRSLLFLSIVDRRLSIVDERKTDTTLSYLVLSQLVLIFINRIDQKLTFLFQTGFSHQRILLVKQTTDCQASACTDASNDLSSTLFFDQSFTIVMTIHWRQRSRRAKEKRHRRRCSLIFNKRIRREESGRLTITRSIENLLVFFIKTFETEERDALVLQRREFAANVVDSISSRSWRRRVESEAISSTLSLGGFHLKLISRGIARIQRRNEKKLFFLDNSIRREWISVSQRTKSFLVDEERKRCWWMVSRKKCSDSTLKTKRWCWVQRQSNLWSNVRSTDRLRNSLVRMWIILVNNELSRMKTIDTFD